MQAILVRQFGDPDVMQLAKVPDPAPGPGQVVVRIEAAGVNPVDSYIRTGTYAHTPPLPYTPGSDAAGVVEAIGDGIAGIAAGDRVYVIGTADRQHGTYAERAVCTLAQVHPLPDRVSFAQGAALGVPYATAYRALFHRAAARPAETVLVHGATGGVGLAAVELAHAQGMFVIGTGGTDRGMDAAREHGADFVVSHKAPGYLDEIRKATGGRGVDVVVEMATHLNLDKDLGLLAPRGRVVVVGNRGRVEIDARQAMSRDAAVLGMTLFNVGPDDLRSIHAALVAGLENGTLNPVVGRELPLVQAPRAHELVMEPGAFGKIVLTP
ncbi:MAG: NADPH:quinone reductase [Betaproteobacteria bacterium]